MFLSIPDADKIILLGDVNTRVGKDYQTWNCLGSHGIGNANSNSIQLLQFGNEHDLVIGNTRFQREKTKKQKKQIQGLWQYLHSKHWHMIDYIIVRRCDLQDLHSVHTMRGTDYWTDHRLIRTTLALKIHPKARHTTLPRPQIIIIMIIIMSCR